jgi:NhaP-type Na+/H+ or K+/H+ antiporter
MSTQKSAWIYGVMTCTGIIGLVSVALFTSPATSAGTGSAVAPARSVTVPLYTGTGYWCMTNDRG